MRHNGLKLDNVIAFEGCPGDDQILLGGKFEFLEHFCSLFTFDECHAPHDNAMTKKSRSTFDDPQKLNDSIDDFMKKFDDIK